jgi:sensor c-di-GMP phosphodiesterase-like protein
MISTASVSRSTHLYTVMIEHLGQRMFETTFKNLGDTLRKDASYENIFL